MVRAVNDNGRAPLQWSLRMPQPAEPPTALPPQRSTLIAFLVAGAFFMENLDGTVIATAIPKMAGSFATNPVDLNTGMTAYMLTLAVFIPVSGWLANRIGARAVFASAIALFTVASIICGMSNNLQQFTYARILQGIGGAMMVPVGRLVVLRVTEKKDLIDAISYITWPALVAPVLGPPVGGYITDTYSWRWIFYLNIPLGIAGFVLALLWIRNDHENADRPFDWLGFALAGSACVAFMYSLELLARQDAALLLGGLLLVAAIAVSWLTVRHLRRTEHPLIDFACLKQHTFMVSMRGGTLFRTAIMASPFLLPLMFQVTFGLSARNSGLLVMAMFAGNLMMKSITTPILRRYGFRKVLLANGVVSTLIIMACGLLSPRTPLALIVAVLFIHGLSRSMQFTSINTLAFVDISKSMMTSATSFSAAVQQMGMGMGVAVGALALRIASLLRGTHANAPVLTDFHIAFVLVAMLSACALWDCLSLDKLAGAEVSGHA